MPATARRSLPAVLAIVAFLGPLALAIENPVDKTGFNPTSIYENFGNESIDPLGGNLALVFPFVPVRRSPAAGWIWAARASTTAISGGRSPATTGRAGRPIPRATG